MPKRQIPKKTSAGPQCLKSLSDLALSSEHCFCAENMFKGVLCCTSCNHSYNSKIGGVRRFISGMCIPKCRPTSCMKATSGSESINGVSTHPSHQLCVRDGSYYCSVCGYLAKHKIHHLKAPCVGPGHRTQHGSLTLRQVELGYAPTFRG